MVTGIEYHGNSVSRCIVGAIEQLKEEYHEEEACESVQDRHGLISKNKKKNDEVKDGILRRIKNIIMPSKKTGKPTMSLNAKAKSIIEIKGQFPILKEKMQSSGLVTNQGIQEILPCLIDRQRKEIAEENIMITLNGVVKDCNHDIIGSYVKNVSRYAQEA